MCNFNGESSDMLSGEAKPFLDSVQADIAATEDPALRGWYENEMPFDDGYKEAVTIRQTLHALGNGLAQLVEKATQAEEEATETTAETESVHIDQPQVEEYVTPEEKRRKTVLRQLDALTADYKQDSAIARSQPKVSKREKKEGIALRKFGKSFERIGSSQQHIVYDPEALAVVIETLNESGLGKLTEAAIQNCESYMLEHGVEFAQDSAAFAKLILLSTREDLQPDLDRILSAIYEKKHFTTHPEKAASLYISSAYASLEPLDGKNHEFFRKMHTLRSGECEIIKDSGEFRAGISAMLMGAHHIDELLPLVGDLWNARFLDSQFRHAFLVEQPETQRSSTDAQLQKAGNSLGLRYGNQDKASQIIKEWAKVSAFAETPQHTERFGLFDLVTGEPLPISVFPVEMPEEIKTHFYDSRLFALRKERLAPRGLVHDMIRTQFQQVTHRRPNIIGIPISPGLTITYGTTKPPSLQIIAGTHNMLAQLLKDHPEKLSAHLYQGSNHQEIARFGVIEADISDDPEQPEIVDIYLRPSVPDDQIFAESPYSALFTSLGADVDKYEAEASLIRHYEKLRYLIDHRNHYLGRRAVHFNLPEKYQSRGLQAIELRQHPDRQHIYVSAVHKEGRLVFLFDKHFKMIGRDGTRPTSTGLTLAFEDMVIALATEWITRPVIETSEGTVSVHDQKSRVNLGFLRYLPEGQGFSERQRRIFTEEQHGNLAAESERRRAIDPEGLGRNSTYVKENFDPNRPALEVYYDHNKLGTVDQTAA